MTNIKTLTAGLILILGLAGFSSGQSHRLYYDEPAEEWVEALPLGNGRLGAMVYGGVTQEHIQFNEETLWTGKPHDYANKGSHQYLGEIRQLLEDGKQREAEILAMDKFMSVPLRQKAYQPFGDLIMDFPGHEKTSNYSRSLDLETAICEVSYDVNGVKFSREVFVSEPEQVIVIKLESSKPGTLEFSASLESSHFLKSIQTEGNTQTLTVKVHNGVLYGQAGLKVITDGLVNPEYRKLKITEATQATLYLGAYTNFRNYNDVSANPERQITGLLNGVEGFDYANLRENHISEYRDYYTTFDIGFGEGNGNQTPTDERIYNFWKSRDDPGLLALYVQYARYLLISSSRPGTHPANLQGIWNHRLKPSWDSKYTTNINAEMNYWPAEMMNLSRCHEPLFDMIDDLAKTGSSVAMEHYDLDGWVFHHNTDIWRGAAPINNSNHGIWPTGGAWLTTHLWEHFLYTRDLDFLEDKYPVMRDAALFFTQFLVEDPVTDYLISTPSNSPENGGLVAGPTMDHQLIRALFNACIEAADLLDTDHDFARQLAEMVPRIAPNQIGQHGQLQEWLEDKDDPDNHHRHVSHLWGVHPGNEINWEKTPDLMKAARQSLVFRGDEGTGWSLAWKINFWSRFREGDRAYDLIHMLLSPAGAPGRKIRGGSYPNLFDAHPPFQIDGNFGGAAGIVETLIQSHLGHIDLLPALPDNLREGEVKGVCARGGFELSFAWNSGKLQQVEVLSKAGEPCKLKYGKSEVAFETRKGERYRFNGKLKKR